MNVLRFRVAWDPPGGFRSILFVVGDTPELLKYDFSRHNHVVEEASLDRKLNASIRRYSQMDPLNNVNHAALDDSDDEEEVPVASTDIPFLTQHRYFEKMGVLLDRDFDHPQFKNQWVSDYIKIESVTSGNVVHYAFAVWDCDNFRLHWKERFPEPRTVDLPSPGLSCSLEVLAGAFNSRLAESTRLEPYHGPESKTALTFNPYDDDSEEEDLRVVSPPPSYSVPTFVQTDPRDKYHNICDKF